MEVVAEAPNAPLPALNFFHPLMLATVGIVAAALMLTSYHLIISKFCIRRTRPAPQHYHASDNSRGVEEKVLSSIPVQAYKNKQEETSLNQCECTVCLGEFEDGDPVRVLPSCKHVFHLQCIDEWFFSHSSCPLCRSPVVWTPSSASSIVVDTNGLNETQVIQDSIVISIDDDDGTRTNRKISLRRCSSVSMPFERKQQLLLARSVSDCFNVSINKPPPSSSSSSNKVDFSRLGPAPVMRIRSFSRIRPSQGGIE